MMMRKIASLVEKRGKTSNKIIKISAMTLPGITRIDLRNHIHIHKIRVITL